MIDALENILDGLPIDFSIDLLLDSLQEPQDTIDELKQLIEKRVCRRGPRMQRKIKGRLVTVYKRICRGQPSAAASNRAKRSARRSRQARAKGQRNRWRNKRR